VFPCAQKNTTVTHLQLAGNDIGSVGAVYLKTVLTLNQDITYLVSEFTEARLLAVKCTVCGKKHTKTQI